MGPDQSLRRIDILQGPTGLPEGHAAHSPMAVDPHRLQEARPMSPLVTGDIEHPAGVEHLAAGGQHRLRI